MLEAERDDCVACRIHTVHSNYCNQILTQSQVNGIRVRSLLYCREHTIASSPFCPARLPAREAKNHHQLGSVRGHQAFPPLVANGCADTLLTDFAAVLGLGVGRGGTDRSFCSAAARGASQERRAARTTDGGAVCTTLTLLLLHTTLQVANLMLSSE